ncbi:MAG: hydrogenase maturation protease [Methanoregulaceae archaeon]|nr:hydrogenase maturation protease [Methanoregulaceae archaeon]
MKKAGPGSRFAGQLRRRLKGAVRIAVVGVGEELSPVDRLGMDTAREIGKQQIPGVCVFCAGTVPESMTGPLRDFQPDHVIFIDAADMGEEPGTFAIVQPGKIQASLMSTHVLPLSVVMEFVEKDSGAKVTLVGIQPDLGRTGELTPGEKERICGNIEVMAGVLREISV